MNIMNIEADALFGQAKFIRDEVENPTTKARQHLKNEFERLCRFPINEFSQHNWDRMVEVLEDLDIA